MFVCQVQLASPWQESVQHKRTTSNVVCHKIMVFTRRMIVKTQEGSVPKFPIVHLATLSQGNAQPRPMMSNAVCQRFIKSNPVLTWMALVPWQLIVEGKLSQENVLPKLLMSNAACQVFIKKWVVKMLEELASWPANAQMEQLSLGSVPVSLTM